MDESSANYCWQKQETQKGSRLPGGTMYGGWRFYVYNYPVWSDVDNRWNTVLTNYTSAQASAMVADGSITNNPVFNRGFTPMFDHDMSQDDQWLALAKYVPAVSHPVGGNKVLDSTDYYDFDMNQERFVPRPNGWGRPAVNGEYPWKHSDMKDLAYFGTTANCRKRRSSDRRFLQFAVVPQKPCLPFQLAPKFTLYPGRLHP